MSSNQESAPDAKESNAPGIITDKVAEVTCAQCGCKIDVSEVQPFVKVECPDCHNIETVPAKLGHFTLVRLIGTGGMGGVYCAKDESLDRFVAIKVMLESLGKDKEFIETFKREAQAVARLNHPHIAQIYSFGMEKNQPYIVMELVAGQRFDKMISSGAELDQGLVMKIGLEMAEALSAADEIGLIHGDIKPENILLDEKWQAKLVDFGLARFVGQAAEDGIWGTPYYIAPEKVRRQKVDSRSDMYSLGATLYHALAGKPPFDGTTPVEVVKARLSAAPLHLLRKNVHDEVENIVMRMLQGQPARRYPNYASLLSDLRKIVKDLGADRKNYAASAGRKTVKLLVSKKAGALKSTAPVAETARATGPIKPGHKKRTTSFVVTAGTTRNIDDTALTDMDMSDVNQSVLDEFRKKKLADAAREDIAREKKVKVFLWIVLLLTVGTIGYGAFKKLEQKSIRERQDRETMLALQGEMAAANDTYAKLHVVATNIVAMENPARLLAEKATNTVALAIHEGIDQPPQAGEPSIKTAARKVVDETAKVREKAVFARQTDAAALTLKNETVKATTVVQTRSGVGKLIELLAAMTSAGSEARQHLANAQQGFDEVAEIKSTMDKEKKENSEKTSAEKKELEAAKRAEEHKALVQGEIKAAEALQSDCMPLISQNKYLETAVELGRHSFDFKTDEGKDALKMLIERCNRLQTLKAFVVERLSVDQFPWGYYDAETRGQLDVLGADDKEVKVRGKNVPWTAVNPAQMKKFIDHALASENLPLRTQGEQNLAAAVFSLLHGADKAAKTYLDRALDVAPTLRSDAKLLLPSLQ